MDKPKFIPKPGQVDFTNIRYCPVINCVVQYGEKFLLVERSEKLRLYPKFWNGISGFLDDDMSREEKVMEELREELGISENDIVSIRFGEIFDQEAPEYKKTWIVHPVLVVIKTDSITLDQEAQQYKWVKLEELKNYKLLPGFETVVEHVCTAYSHELENNEM
ncbi:MAG: NUDIX domain-containing protein [bacterium]|nr:NUDIX domain-containing protein [bacterium]